MPDTDADGPPRPTPRPAPRLRVWHLALLVLFVAVAIRNIQDQRRDEPALIALAVLGFIGYWVVGWWGWGVSRRWERRLGATPLLVLYLIAMAGVFLAATVIYLGIEYEYLIRRH